MKNIIIAAAVALAGISSFAEELKVSVNPDKTFQKVDHFTAADAWSGNFVGKYFAEPQKAQIAEWLFSDKIGADGNPEGIGLSMWRINVGGGSLEQDGADIEPYQRRAEAFLTIDGKNCDWGKCSGQQYFIKKAREYGCNKFLLFSNTPPVQWTLNGKGYADKNASSVNLKPDCFGKFADHLADVAKHFQDEGYNIDYVSPVNEPQVPWNSNRQEGSPWRASDKHKIFVELDSALGERKLDNTKMLLGEAADLLYIYKVDRGDPKGVKDWRGMPENDRPNLYLQKFYDPQSPQYLLNLKHMPKMVGGHSYHSHTRNEMLRKVRTELNEACEKLGVEFQQTEWCLLPHFNAKNHDGIPQKWLDDNRAGIYSALVMGRIICDDFNYAKSTAWGYWKGMEINGNYALIGVYPVNGDLTKGGVARTNKLLWALGNFSFFVRPGYSRIEISGADDLNKVVSVAFASPDRKRIVAIFVNSSEETFEADVSLPEAFAKNIETVRAFRTDPRMDMGNLLIQSKNRLSIAPLSITTLVLDIK